MRHTPSSLALYETCPRQWHHVRVLKDVEPLPDTEQQVWGREVHRLLAQALADAETGLPLPELEWAARQIRKVAARADEAPRSEVRMGLDRAMERVDYEDAWIRGVADLVAVNHGMRRALVADWKTGRRRDPVDFGQLDFYTLVAFHTTGAQLVKQAYYYPFEEGERRVAERWVPLDQLPALQERVKARAETAERPQNYEPRPSGLCRQHCPVLTCEHNGRRP